MPRGEQQGFTYIWLLTVVALVGVGLAALGPRWADETQREQEQALLRVGELYAQAITRYYESSPGSQKRFPRELQDLLLDTRFVGTRRYLRSLYADPLSPQRAWGVVRAADGGVQGVYSLDPRAPWRTTPWRSGAVELPAARAYHEWRFIAKVAP